MPFDTVGGLPPMPTQRFGATVYQPRQTRTFPHTRPVRTRATQPLAPTFPGTPTASPHQQSNGGAWPTEAACHSAEPKGEAALLPALPPIRTVVGEAAVVAAKRTCLSYPTTTLADVNPWCHRTTATELEAEQRLGIYGAAQFRPALVPDDLSAAAEAVTARKPLLQPYLYAQEIARGAAVETWQVRRSRYLQWLRKDAVKSLEAGHGGRTQPVFLGTSMAAMAGLSGGESVSLPVGVTHGTEERPRPGTESLVHTAVPTSLKMKTSQHGGTPNDSNNVFTPAVDTSAHAVAGMQQRSVTDGSPCLVGANASTAAVRRLFLAARAAAAATRANGAGASTSSSPVRGSSLSSSSCSNADVASPLTVSASRASVPTSIITVLPVADCVAAAAAAESDDGSPLNQGSARKFAEEPVTEDATLALEDFDDSESDVSDYESSGKATVSPPSEYDLAGILRDRMHHTVALFSPSSQATLEEPPVNQTTHPVLGQARLAAGSATQRLLPQEPALSHTPLQHSPYAYMNSGGDADADCASSAQTRPLQRLLYEESYNRGLLSQLAWQSSPTRWYSQQLPTGKKGIQYRLINAPALKSDEAVRQRLQQAMLHAATTIAVPRATHMAQQQAAAKDTSRPQPHGRTDTTSFLASASTPARCMSLPLVDLSTADEARLTVECAASEKEVLFRRWIELHVTVAAQLALLRSEESCRRKLLGEFLSCCHPLPCPHLDCDLEVLRMSAVPLEPTVKPLCLYTSVVLGRHRDILQREMLAEYQAELDLLHSVFRVGFRAIYSYAKLVAEETRRFEQLIHYHEFCLVIAARTSAADPIARSGNAQPPDAPHTRQPSLTLSTEAVTPVVQRLPDVALDAPPTPRKRASVVQPRDEGMWRLRQRRLRQYAAWDSPFFSYLVYTEMVTTASAEAAVRAALQTEEEAGREELKVHLSSEAAFARLQEAERQARASVDAARAEAHAAMLTGPLARLHAALVEERRAERAAAYERACEEARVKFVAVAVAEKAAMESEQLAWYRPYVRELRQRFLSQVVASRSEGESKAASRAWLWRQQHASLFSSEQRLRDRIGMTEEAEAFAELGASAEASLRHAVKRAARREQREAARLQAEAQRVALAAQEEQDRVLAVLEARLRRAERIADPSKRPSASMDRDKPNTYDRLATALQEDLEAFLPSLTHDA